MRWCFNFPFYVCNACEDELVMMSKLLQMLERLEKRVNWHRRSLIWMHGRRNTVWEEEGARHRPLQLRRSNVSRKSADYMWMCDAFRLCTCQNLWWQISELTPFLQTEEWYLTQNRSVCVNLEWFLPDWGELKNILQALCLKVVIENLRTIWCYAQLAVASIDPVWSYRSEFSLQWWNRSIV